MFNSLSYLLSSGEVERFHAVPFLTGDKVGTHSWGVAMIVQAIAPNCSKSVILAAMFHDCAELVTGDIPAPVKSASPDINLYLSDMEKNFERTRGLDLDLHPTEAHIVRMADILHGMWYSLNRINMGERAGRIPFDNWRRYFQDEYERLSHEGVQEEQLRANEFYQALIGELVSL